MVVADLLFASVRILVTGSTSKSLPGAALARRFVLAGSPEAASVVVAAGLSVVSVVLTASEPCREKTITSPSVMLVINAPSR